MSDKQKTRGERGERSFQLDLTESDYAALQERAAEQQMPMTMLVRRLVRQWLQEQSA